MTDTETKTIPQNIGRIVLLLSPAIPFSVSLFMTLYPGWNQIVVDNLAVWLKKDDAAAVVLVLFGFLISVCWLAIKRWCKAEADLREERRRADPEDQKKFTIVLRKLSDSTGLFGWLMNGRFSGKKWRSSDLNYIHELLGPPYKSIEFRDSDLQIAYTNLHMALLKLVSELGEHAGETSALLDENRNPNGQTETYISTQGTVAGDGVAERLSMIADDAIDARTSFLEAGRKGKLSDTELIESAVRIGTN